MATSNSPTGHPGPPSDPGLGIAVGFTRILYKRVIDIARLASWAIVVQIQTACSNGSAMSTHCACLDANLSSVC